MLWTSSFSEVFRFWHIIIMSHSAEHNRQCNIDQGILKQLQNISRVIAWNDFLRNFYKCFGRVLQEILTPRDNNTGDLLSAISIFEAIVQKDKKCGEAWYYLGLCHQQGENEPLAISAFNKYDITWFRCFGGARASAQSAPFDLLLHLNFWVYNILCESINWVVSQLLFICCACVSVHVCSECRCCLG